MGDVIEFLARVGRDASLRRARGDGYDEALERAGFDPSTTRALKARDGDTLRVLMGHGVYFDVSGHLVCKIGPLDLRSAGRRGTATLTALY